MPTLKLVGAMALLVTVGAPMVWYLWEVLNELLAGQVNGLHTFVALPLLVAFVGFLVLVSRAVLRWDARDAE